MTGKDWKGSLEPAVAGGGNRLRGREQPAGAGQAPCDQAPRCWSSGMARMAPAQAEQRAGPLTVHSLGRQELRGAPRGASCLREGMEPSWGRRWGERSRGPRARPGPQRRGDPAPVLAPSCHLAFRWASHTAVVMKGGLVTLSRLLLARPKPCRGVCGPTARMPTFCPW